MTGRRLLAAWVLLLTAGSSVAREASVAPPDAPDEAGAAALSREAAGETAGGGEMPEPSRSPAIDLFAAGPTLRAHELRGLAAGVVGLILGSPAGGEIALEALATPLRGEGGRAELPLFIEIDGPSFLSSNQSRTARVEVYAYALGADDQVAAFLAEVFAVDVQELGEAIWHSGLKFYGHLDLPPGEYRLRVLIRNYQSGASGLRELALEVPAFAALARPFVLCPLFPPPPSRDAWLAVRESRAPADYPLVAGERAFSPAVRPVLVSGRRSVARLFAYGLGAAAPKGRVELLSGGEVVADAPLETASREGAGGEGPEVFEITFEAPRIDPGVYFLRVELAGGARSQPAAVVVVQQAGASDRELLWTDLRGSLGAVHGAAPRPAAAAPEAAAEEEKRLGRAERKVLRAARREEEQRIGRLADSYRRALLAWGRGEESAARGALLDLESSVLADGALLALRSAQLTVAEQLAARDVESLVPVLVLHDDAYRTYRQRRLYSLGFNARALIETLAEIYAERGGTPGSAVVAAHALACLGGRLQAANLPTGSRQLYARALAHDPANRAALLGLATSFERYGEYPQAVEILERLAASHPAFAEGLLRLAVNLDRLGLRARGRELLARALELEARDWVRSLAYQNLARIDLETGDLDGAAQLLERSLAEIPDQHGAVYLLAHVYDRRRQAFKALELLRTIAPAVPGAASERKRYDSWPEETLAAARRELAEAARVRLDLVAGILQGAAGQ